jgi:hypothetical protein
VPPRDGEGAPPDGSDQLLAKIIPLRRRAGEPKGPQILVDEPRRASEPQEHPPAASEWSIWEPPPDELRLPEREPPAPSILKTEPARASDPSEDPSGSSEWSVWDRPPAHLGLRRGGDAARFAGPRARVRRRRPSRRRIGAAAAAAMTATAAAALAFGLGA